MKTFFLSVLLLPLLFSCSKTPAPVIPDDGRPVSFKQLADLFEDPSPEFRTAPFWVWNNDVSKKDIDRSLEEFKDKGIGGAFIHPRYGLITEYLSDEWFDLVSYSLKKAEELDLKLWIYDENSFPSGFAGGHVAARMPEANSEGVALKPHYTDILEIPDELERVIHIFKKADDQWIDITDKAESEIGNEGYYCLFDLNDYERSKWFGGYSYVDLLKPGVTEEFIDITMPGYERVLGSEFGKRVPGVFTDEPNINTRSAGPVRYTPDLYEEFEKQWGYKLQPHLMSLITETGDWKKIRHNYQSVLLRLFIERWSVPWYEYTENKDLLWTGHYWEHGWPNPKEGPDNMAMYAWHQIPGVDMLFNAEDLRPDQFGNVRNVRELASVANQFGRKRALSETYGAAGWELTFEDMKRLGDWEYVLGVNFMNQHLSYISLTGDRKHDFPQSFGPYAPYWGVYRYQADYFARLSVALSSGVQDNDMLVIEPTTTAWMYYNPAAGNNDKLNNIKEVFEDFLDQLELFQVEYDLGSENIINDHGAIEDNKFLINKADYNKVILPPGIENIDNKTFQLLEQFAKNHGQVIEFGTKLNYVDGKPCSYDELRKQENWKVITSVDRKSMTGLAENDHIFFEKPDSLSSEVFHQRRMLTDGQLLFITNFGKENYVNFNVNMHGRSVLKMNPADGSIKPYVFRRERGKVHFSVILPPAGSLLLFVSNKSGKSKSDHIRIYEHISDERKTRISRVNPNILTLDYVELTMDKYKQEPMYFYTAANEIWKAHGYPDNPWVSSSQFKTELIEADTFPEGSGFEAVYPFYVDEDMNNREMQLVVERSSLYTVKINGQEILPVTGKSWLDPDFHIFQIGDFINEGRNEILLKASPFSIYCELEPVYLSGDFNVVSSDKGWKIENSKKLELGSWKDQGMPFYGQVVAYSKDIDVKVEGRYAVKLRRWKGTVAEVLVNGKHRGIIQAPPYELIMDLPYGLQEVTVKVAGSLKNTFGPHHNFNTPGIVTPWSFKSAPANQPPGDEYDLIDYGLMQDIVFYRMR